MPLARDARAHP